MNIETIEPQVLPAPTITPVIQPGKDDPFNVPAPLINPTPKGIGTNSGFF
jgi:hypothetical protein